jgi:3-oxoacyl-[acyl-carrier-protein] synthase-3
MRFDGSVGIAGVASWLPTTREALAGQISAGRLGEDAAERLGVTELPVSDELAPPQMAVLAGRAALARAGCGPDAVGTLTHAWMYHQGHDKWSPAHYVANELGLPATALPVGVQELSHGGASALYLSASAVLAHPPGTLAMVTTADRFGAPVWDRWLSHTDIGYGDGATAAVLHRHDGTGDEFVLLSMTVSAAAWLEGLERGTQPFTRSPMQDRATMESNTRRRQFYEVHGKESLGEAATAGVRDSLRRALDEAGLEADDPRIRLVTLPRLGPRLVGLMYLSVLESELKAEVVRLGGNTGHLGAGDLIANLADVARDDLLAPGEIAVMCGAGAGFTWSTTIVQRPA